MEAILGFAYTGFDKDTIPFEDFWDELDPLSSGQEWRFYQHGDDYEYDIALMVSASISVVETGGYHMLGKHLPFKQRWNAILFKACQTLGIPFDPEQCQWLMVAASF